MANKSLKGLKIIDAAGLTCTHSLGCADMPIAADVAARLFTESGYREWPVTGRHTSALSALSMRHADPFDCLSIAQATIEPMRRLSPDRLMAVYGETVFVI